jgi:membrane protease YdiL (CAAX protease family)
MQYPVSAPKAHDPAWVFSRMGFSCFVILALTTVLQTAASLLITRAAPQWTLHSWYLWAVTFLPMYFVAVPVGTALFRRVPAREPVQSKLSAGRLMILLMMCIGIMYIGNIAGLAVNALFGSVFGLQTENPLNAYVNTTNLFMAFLFMVVLAPIVEEFVFRKLILDRIAVYGEGTAILVSALTFALFHGNFHQLFYAFGLGALFAFLYLRTGRLRYSVLFHMLINFLGGVLGPLLSGMIDADALSGLQTDNPQQAMAQIGPQLSKIMLLGLYGLTMIGLAVAGLVLLIVKRKTFVLMPSERQLQKGTGFRTVLLNPGMLFFFVLSLVLMVLLLVS